MTLVKVIRDTLTKTMTQTERVLTMLEAGCETSMDKKALRNAVGVSLREGEFKSEGGKWMVD